MARGRFVATTIATDERLANLSLDAEYLYLKTIPHLDRDGLIDGRTRYVWATVAPFRSELLDRCGALIQEWLDVGLVVRYEGARTPVLWFCGFAKNQIGLRYDRDAASVFPPPPGYVRSGEGLLPEECRRNAGVGPANVRLKININNKININIKIKMMMMGRRFFLKMLEWMIYGQLLWN